MPTSVVVVAGGRSRRMGRDKRRLRVWGDDQPMLLERTVGLAQQFSDDVLVVLNDPEQWQHLGVRLVSDRYPDGGVLGGIASGLAAIHHEWAWVVGCDFPLLTPVFVQGLLDLPRTTDAIVPRLNGATTRNAAGWQPLCAVYRRACLVAFEAALAAQRLSVAAALDHLTVLPWNVSPRDQIALTNINTPDDLAQLMVIHRDTSDTVQ